MFLLRQYRTKIVLKMRREIFRQIATGILTYVKGFLCKMTENIQADSVQRRQAVFVRCCLKYSFTGGRNMENLLAAVPATGDTFPLHLILIGAGAATLIALASVFLAGKKKDDDDDEE